MKNQIKRILMLVLVISIVFTSIVGADTISFTDVENDWAKDYIVRATELGIIKGYEDSTFRPKNNVTMLETIIMLSRLYQIDEDLHTQIINKYNTYMTDNINAKYKWAYNELSVAVELGIVSKDALKTLNDKDRLSTNATREEVAVLMTKAMLLKEEAEKIALTFYVLPFNDASKIDTKAKPYVYIMKEKGIFGGDDKGNINPTGQITRKEFSKVISVAYNYLKTNNVTPTFSDYETYNTLKGTIKNITVNPIESYLEIELDDTKAVKVIRMIEDTTVIKIDKNISKIAKLEIGMAVECKVSVTTNITKQIIVDTNITVVPGTIKYVYYTTPKQLIIYDKNKNEISYQIADSVVATLDGKITDYKNLTKNDKVYVKLVDNIVKQIDSISRLQTLTGKIKDIQYGIPIKLLVEDSAGLVKTFTYETEPTVTRNNSNTSFDQLRVGDSVIVKTEYDVLTAIDATAAVSSAQTSGVIKEIIIGSPSSISIQSNEGGINQYKLSNTAKISVLNATATVYDLRVGYCVRISCDGNEIISIEADETETSQQITGKIIYVNKEKKQIMLQVKTANNDTENVYVNIADAIIITVNGDKKYYTDLAIGQTVSSVGSYSGGTFNAKNIMIL